MACHAYTHHVFTVIFDDLFKIQLSTCVSIIHMKLYDFTRLYVIHLYNYNSSLHDLSQMQGPGSKLIPDPPH